MTKQVIATRTGFFNGARRRAGETFTVPKNATGSWFAPDKAAEAEAKAKAKADAEAKAKADADAKAKAEAAKGKKPDDLV